jgi:hypothetical protein
LADGVTIDPANAAVISFRALMITGTAGPTNPSDRDGNVLVTVAGGILQKRKQRRRLNAFILDPSETEPAE